MRGNELKLTQIELFLVFHFMCVAVNASVLFFIAQLSNTECFLYPFNHSF